MLLSVCQNNIAVRGWNQGQRLRRQRWSSSHQQEAVVIAGTTIIVFHRSHGGRRGPHHQHRLIVSRGQEKGITSTALDLSPPIFVGHSECRRATPHGILQYNMSVASLRLMMRT